MPRILPAVPNEHLISHTLHAVTWIPRYLGERPAFEIVGTIVLDSAEAVDELLPKLVALVEGRDPGY